MKQKWLNNRFFRILLSLLGRMIISWILFTAVISLGLQGKNKETDKNFDIDIFGMPIFQVVDGVSSVHMGNMTFISVVISAICIVIGEFIAKKIEDSENKKEIK